MKQIREQKENMVSLQVTEMNQESIVTNNENVKRNGKKIN